MRRPFAFLALVFTATPLAGQVVRGRLSATTESAAGAIVILVDSAGKQVARGLSGPNGSYLLRAPSEGRYTLRVLRIGFAAYTSAPMALVVGTPVDLSPSLPDDPILLNDLQVAGGGECSNGDSSGATALLLEEVQKAFGSAELALQDRDLRFEVMRRLERSGRKVEPYTDSSASVLRGWPVQSLPAELLRDHGFVQSADSVDINYVQPGAEGKIWFGPDPLTLFSVPFLATHCYDVNVDRRDADRVGLRFRPSRGRKLPDIEGTLWLRRRTLALERIEYKYVNLPRHLTDASAVRPSGEMDLLRLPSGLWIVKRWSLTAPIEEVHGTVPTGIAGWQEQSGEIRHIKTRAGTVVY